MFYKVLGLMSGTSLDGLDLAYCEFELLNGKWHYCIRQAETVEYSVELKNKILACEESSGEYLAFMDSYLGSYFGKQARIFLDKYNLEPDFISSHGQTVFHRPEKKFTLQIGDINSLCAESRCSVIGDFRSLDVALQGQGAPLVPIGDKELFSDYDCCLNLGGFSNISFQEGDKRKAYDICPVNIVLNYLVSFLGMPFDRDGETARSGEVEELLLQTLNSLPYYVENQRKSLGKEWVRANIFPLICNSPYSPQDLLATYTEHVAVQLAKHITGRTLVSGGGAYNRLLVEKLRAKTSHEIIIPDKATVDFKEAMIFAFLGVKRVRKEINCLASVTGAKKDSCSGTVVYWNNI